MLYVIPDNNTLWQPRKKRIVCGKVERQRKVAEAMYRSDRGGNEPNAGPSNAEDWINWTQTVKHTAMRADGHVVCNVADRDEVFVITTRD